MTEAPGEIGGTPWAWQQKEQCLRLLLEAVAGAMGGYAVILLDVQGRITSWDGGAEYLIGYRREDVFGKHFSFFYATEDILSGKPGDDLQHALVGPVRGDVLRMRKDGTNFWADTVLTALRDESGALRGYGIVLHDITERKAAEAERLQLLVSAQRARQQAEEANRLKDEFLAAVSHELRTPLSSILGWVRVLSARKTPDPASLAKGITIIERNTKALAQLIDDLLDISRIVTGKLKLEVLPVDLRQIIDAALDSARPAAEAKGLVLEKEFDGDGASVGLVRGDADRLQQVVWNLLSNAIKFTPERGRVRIKLKSAPGQAIIEVEDTGAGIPPDFLPYVFDRFRQADGSAVRKHGGLGLGLAIVRHLVELHGGTVQAMSEGEGQGARLSVRLPCPTGDEPECEPSARELATGMASAPGPGVDAPVTAVTPLAGVRILLVEDDTDIRELLAETLTYQGAEVQTAIGVTQALSVLGRWWPDVLVSDIFMPGEDGYSLIRKVRALPLPGARTLPAIALTGHAQARDRTRVLAVGFQMHVPKPVDPGELAMAISRLLEAMRR
ncbi:MAG TPA: ATP-binding protein [Polyangia bacterium]|jgi:PAS domain S-box-containing protein|nr:ATP-binding protein [Polyangia bacterium]